MSKNRSKNRPQTRTTIQDPDQTLLQTPEEVAVTREETAAPRGPAARITLIAKRRTPPRPVQKDHVVRLSPEAHAELQRLAYLTGLSMSKVASELVIQGAGICAIERR